MSDTTPTTPPPIDLGSVFEIKSDKSYEPLHVRFRGEDYMFGSSALSILRALSTDSSDLSKKEGESDSAYTQRLIEQLPSLVATLCPEFPEPPWDVEEELGIFRAVTEVLRRVSQVRFPAQ